MLWCYVVFSSLYIVALLYLIYLWQQKFPGPEQSGSAKVSVIVPFRNEAINLPILVAALKKQPYPFFEVLFVNDHSEDQSLELLEQALAGEIFAHKVLHLKDTYGKKSAISLGGAAASGELILTTDADCRFDPNWVTRMAAAFSSEAIQMVSGPVALTGSSLFQQWQQMEFSVLIAAGAIGIVRNKPAMANGANLAYRKKAFESVGGFAGIDDIASGDDELLLMKINNQFPDSIRFLKDQAALVVTEALPDWKSFRNQRLRWAGKWKYGKRFGAIAGALAVFIFNLALIALPLIASFDLLPWWLVGVVFSSRFLTEVLLITSLSGFFRYRVSILLLILHQILYPFYAVYFGVAANFGKYNWKGRIYKTPAQ